MEINVSVNLPTEVENQLQRESLDLTSVAREAIAIDLFRRAILTHLELSRVLGLDRFETDALLKRHQVSEHALSHDDVNADLRTIDELIGPSRS